MAIFVFFAWMIEAAEALGMIEIEAQDSQSRAYRLAHEGLTLVKNELIGSTIEVLGEGRIRRRDPDGRKTVIEDLDGRITRRGPDGDEEELIDLGRGGGLGFLRYGRAGLEVKIHARTEDGGSYDVNLILPPFTRPAVRES